MTFTA